MIRGNQVALTDLAAALRAEGVAPNVALGVSTRSVRGWVTEAGGEDNLVFDLASVTKSMTAIACVLAGLARDVKLATLLPELAATFAGGATLEALLSHRAGLQGHINLFHPLLSGMVFERAAALFEAANAQRSDVGAPPFDALYSDMGYALVGEALARTATVADAGDAINALVGKRVQSGRLGVARDFSAASCAATEDVPWRGGLLRGIVHDENAFALTGTGGSGHAGMFGDVHAVLEFGRHVLDGMRGRGPFATHEIGWLLEARPGGTQRAGFDGKSAEGSSAGTVLGPSTIGHLGFTGTSLWMDPDAGLVTVFLSNRVSPTRDNQRIRAARPRVHDALAMRGLALR
jgi:serine-type D-Ala-D-Ala carboxypeptidase